MTKSLSNAFQTRITIEFLMPISMQSIISIQLNLLAVDSCVDLAMTPYKSSTTGTNRILRAQQKRLIIWDNSLDKTDLLIIMRL